MILRNKTAIVTGAGRGIGRATAMTLAAQGARVIVNDYGVAPDGTGPRTAPADETVAAIVAAGGEAVAHAGSVADEADVYALIELCHSRFGSVDILVNNAGIIIRNLLADTPVEDWDRMIAVHLRGMYLTSKAVAPRMQAQRSGRIINFTSISGLMGIAGSNAYTAAKAGVLGLTWLLADELGFYGITANAIAPSAVSRLDFGVPDNVRRVRRAFQTTGATEMPTVNREPEAVAALVAYLASDEAQYVNGQVIGVGGDRISLWSRPQIVASAFESGPWTVEALQRRFRATIGKDLSNNPPDLPPE